jgi:molecular chaperone DnaK
MNTLAGIDLGTTFSAIAVLDSIGNPVIVPNADGDRLTPSAVYFDEECSSTIRVGIEAINSRHVNTQRSVRWIKRHIGDPDYAVTIDDSSYNAVQLSSLILKKLKNDASLEYGDIQDVVISVPAHFDEVRRKATMDAGTLAGLNVVGIVNEPVAAALYYAATQNVSGKILVYDLGGGTFDVTIMNVNDRNIDIICSQGNHALGGIDFDNCLLNKLVEDYKHKFNADLIESDEDRARLEDEAEDIKKTLSRRPSAKKMLYGPAGNMKIEISREDFEKQIDELICETQMLLDVAIDEASLSPEQINKVLMVGGSTRIPCIGQKLTEVFGFEPERAVNVDECVALGAALQTGLTMLRKNENAVPEGVKTGLNTIHLKDVCNHSYGTLCAPVDKDTGQRKIENRIILKKNTPLPCKASQTFYTMHDGQDMVEVTITQGEGNNPEYVNTIATYKLDLPEDRPAGCPIEATYSYDENQRMHCTFCDLTSGRMLEVDLAIDEQGQIEKVKLAEMKDKLDAVTVE